jgi:hypothetical protein
MIEDIPDGCELYAWHVHHETLAEPLTEPFEIRTRAISKKNESPAHIILRYKLFKKSIELKALVAEYDAKRKPLDDEYYAKLLVLHAVECPDCTWDGKTIFSEKWRKAEGDH